ncbi:MAG: gluconate 2-dehydrogenase subunit 3 family protein [Gemmatimonadaceae bacterium]
MTAPQKWDVLANWRGPDWDEPTRAIIDRRINEIPPIRFLTPHEANTLDAIVERIVGPSVRFNGEPIPVVPWIDAKLFDDVRDGYRYEELPPLREAWRLGLAGIDETARMVYARPFTDLLSEERDAVLRRVQTGDAPGSAWMRLPGRRFFRDVLCLTVVQIYYSHPAAWNEIGYSGPSSPRGHVRTWIGGVDPWEAPDESEL